MFFSVSFSSEQNTTSRQKAGDDDEIRVCFFNLHAWMCFLIFLIEFSRVVERDFSFRQKRPSSQRSDHFKGFMFFSTKFFHRKCFGNVGIFHLIIYLFHDISCDSTFIHESFFNNANPLSQVFKVTLSEAFPSDNFSTFAFTTWHHLLIN